MCIYFLYLKCSASMTSHHSEKYFTDPLHCEGANYSAKIQLHKKQACIKPVMGAFVLCWSVLFKKSGLNSQTGMSGTQKDW